MARAWEIHNLIGVRNGINTTFQIPVVPTGARVRIWQNGVQLYEKTVSPGVNQYLRTGETVEVNIGLAPQADALLWAQIVYELDTFESGFAFDGLPQHAGALLQYVRKTFPLSVRLFNKAGDQLEFIDRDIESIQWRYNTLGGCSEATVRLKRPFDQFGEIGIDYGVEIWRELDTHGVAGATLPATLPMTLGTAFSGTQERRWSGFVRELEPVLQDGEYVELRASGWSRQMEYIIVPERDTPWTNMDVGAIIRDIIDTYVLPGSQIKRTTTLGLVPDTSVVLDTFNGESTAWQMIALLAELAGNAEWGVRADKEFYFRQRTALVKQTHVIGDNISLFRKVESADDVVTRVYLRGADAQRYILTYSDHESGFYKERTLLLPQIADEAQANLWGSAYFARFGESQPSGRVQLVAADDWIEGVGHPLGLFRVVGGPVFVQSGDPLPAMLPMKLGSIYGEYTDQSFRINAITYTPGDDALNIDIELGERGNHLADYLRRIEHRLSEMQQGLIL